MSSIDNLPNGIICTPEQYAISTSLSSIHTTLHCLTRGESIGLTIVSQAGIISLVAVVYVWTIIIFSLFAADVLQAIGAVMDVKWVHDGRVQIGRFCDAQGIVQQLGETGVAIATLTIAAYTFVGVWLGKGVRSLRVATVVVSTTWLFVVLIVILGNTVNRGAGKSRFQAPTPYWCWISKDYLQLRIWGEYFWFWVTLLFSIVVYVPLYLWSRGNITFDDHSWWKLHWHRADENTDPALTGIRRRSLIMLLYPLVYCMLILPLSVVRWIGFVQERGGGENKISATATLAVTAIYGLSGASNVVLLLTTRPESVLFGKHPYVSVMRAPSPVLSTNHDERSESGYESGRQRASKDRSREAGEEEVEEVELGRLPSR
ncbi:hypothetical protein JR316_0001885 [Psilocybe cubensis]|uniref:Glucose receptor Git3 N-terminal domain-containing protein n=2 Tax=Psilocybe cubensis TaxID=181762 RepID=A0A8H7Y295_PSICU|nr:hypothetical protein JR316_0001885 [Psilocybe cubensis]KAH9484981.1 hypothetical protein JR316_0001885 [Psilocybe cubensis]